jgi:hypothetical protein
MSNKKRVALIGNMNNNFFTLCRYLRDLHFDAILYILPYDPKHFLPGADTFKSDYAPYVKTLPWGNPYELRHVTKSEVRKEFRDYDFLIGCGTAPAYLAKAGMKLDLFIPYGSDLYHYPFFNLFTPKKFINYFLSIFKKSGEVQQLPSKPTNIKGYVPFVMNQRKGIRNAITAFFPSSGEDIYAQSLRNLKFRNTHIVKGIPLIYVSEFGGDVIQQQYHRSDWYPKFNNIRARYDFLIFHNCRHNWKNEKDPSSFKGNNRLLEGFAHFLKTYSGKAAIITFEYGSDVDESKKLAEELSIGPHVYWFPVLPRKELMVGMSLSDLVVGNLSDLSWSIYGVVSEALALGKPIMHHRQDELYPAETLYPMINAFSAQMVAHALAKYAANKEQLREIGKKANEWFTDKCIQEPLAQIADLINAKKGD